MLLALLLCASTLWGSARSEGNLTSILSRYPSCATNCSTVTLIGAACPLSNLVNCLCADESVQYKIAACVLSSCSQEDQVVSSTITQNELCVDFPQPSRSMETIRDSIIISCFTFPVVILRMTSRIFIARRVWWDDWMIVLAAIFMVPNTGIPIYISYHGFGKHFWDVSAENIILLQKLFYTSQIFYVLIQNTVKFSILLLYTRIFPNPRFRLYLNICFVWMACHTCAFLFTVIFQCIPIQAVWNRKIQGKCLNFPILTYTGAGFSIFGDLVIMFLPIIELKDLNLGLRKRVALCFMFAIGSFACITSMIRLKYVINIGSSLDGTWQNVDVVIWSEIESYSAVICACLMTIRPLLMKIMPNIFASTSNNSNSRKSKSKSKNTSTNWGRNGGSKMRSGHERLSGDEFPLKDGGGNGGLGGGVGVDGTHLEIGVGGSVGSRTQTERSGDVELGDIERRIEIVHPGTRKNIVGGSVESFGDEGQRSGMGRS